MGMISSLANASPTDWAKSANPETVKTGFELISSLIDEQLAVARAMGYDESLVSKAQADHSTIAIRDHLDGFLPSALLDVRNGKPMELETVLGEVVREGRARNVPIPVRLLISSSKSLLIPVYS